MNNLQKYPIGVIWSDPDQAYVATCPQLSGCATHGTTRQEALENLEQLLPEWMKSAEQNGWEIPTPTCTNISCHSSGKLLPVHEFRIPKKE